MKEVVSYPGATPPDREANQVPLPHCDASCRPSLLPRLPLVELLIVPAPQYLNDIQWPAGEQRWRPPMGRAGADSVTLVET